MIPVVLFACARPEHLRRTLECLCENNVPLIYAFSDGPRSPDNAPSVDEVRKILHEINWCELVLYERNENFGLGSSVLAGVTEVLAKHEMCIVFEDDFICVPGTYKYLCAALNHYRSDPRVMSVTGWTHPRVIPDDVECQPYFDGRAECWVWGTWARAWREMDLSAEELKSKCLANNIDVFRYGAGIPALVELAKTRNIWAVRFLLLHMLQNGLCLRPPRSLVDHIGFDNNATNASDNDFWGRQKIGPCPEIPDLWPEPFENPACPKLWQLAWKSLVRQRQKEKIFRKIKIKLYRFVGRMLKFSGLWKC